MVLEKFAGGRIKDQERQEIGPIFQSQSFTEKCKSINLRLLHLISFTETRKDLWLLSWVGGFCSWDVVLGCPAVNSASGAWAREREQWEIGLRTGSNAGGAGGG